jgi:hypothetical protein
MRERSRLAYDGSMRIMIPPFSSLINFAFFNYLDHMFSNVRF